uniref:Uncharacterized protein n=1 Tax=Globodera rostochiensis TaxID=31243 RepID=A0A914GU70_GLORO
MKPFFPWGRNVRGRNVLGAETAGPKGRGRKGGAETSGPKRRGRNGKRDVWALPFGRRRLGGCLGAAVWAPGL